MSESWALMHYLNLSNNGARRPQLGEFLGKLATGATVDDAFQAAFKTTYEALEKELRDYVKRDTYPGQVATFRAKARVR